MGIKVVTGSRYLGGFIGEGEAQKRWLEGKVAGWADSVETLTGVSRKHLQSAYSGLQKPLQQEWEFLQRVTPGVCDAFGLVHKALMETFLPDLFYGLVQGAPERGVPHLAVKQAGLAITDLTLTAPENWTASCVITVHLVVALRGQVEFQTADHSACLQEGYTAVWRRSPQWAEEALVTTIAGVPVQGGRKLRQATNTVSCPW